MELKVMRSVLTGAALLGLIACSSQQTVGPQGSSGASIPMPSSGGSSGGSQSSSGGGSQGGSKSSSSGGSAGGGGRNLHRALRAARPARKAALREHGRLIRWRLAGRRLRQRCPHGRLVRERKAVLWLTGRLFRRRFAGRWFVPLLRRLVGLIGGLVRFGGLRRHGRRGRLASGQGGSPFRPAALEAAVARRPRPARAAPRAARKARAARARRARRSRREQWRQRRVAEPVSHG